MAPNGVAYAPPAARPGVLPRLLAEILGTRIMVKAALKRAPAAARVLQRILNARQFCLKLIANVTYGYTAAGFSGRMPMAELADSIVQVRSPCCGCTCICVSPLVHCAIGAFSAVLVPFFHGIASLQVDF